MKLVVLGGSDIVSWLERGSVCVCVCVCVCVEGVYRYICIECLQ